MFVQYIKNINYKVLALIISLFVISIFMILSATDADFNNLNRFIKVQSIAFLLGLLIMFLIISIDYKMLGNFNWFLYIIAIFLLLSVYIPGLGIVRNNARSWINLGPIDLQTSELSKLFFIVVLAKYLSKEDRTLQSIKDLIIPSMILLPILLLLLKQPDLGSALVFVVIFIGMLFMAGL